MPRTPIAAVRESRILPPRFTDPSRREKLASAFPDIRAKFKDYLEAVHVPGVAFGIVIDDELAFADALGVRNVETSAPVAVNTVFRIASMSKSFVAMSILKLRDDKKLQLDDSAAKYLPELKSLRYPTSDSPFITIRHLLTMTPGFPEDNPWGDRQMAITQGEFGKWLRAGIPFSNAPGVTFEYSNYAYAMLGRIVSIASGMPFQKYITRNILKPLGMHSTVWDAGQVPPEHLAQGYRYEDESFKPEPILPNGAFAGMAGLFTTVPDFARYMMFLQSAFPPRDGPEIGPVNRATAREMQQLLRFEELVERPSAGDSTWHAVSGYGYGLAIWHDDKLGYGVSHGGGLPGYGSYFYNLPDHGVGLVALTNRTYSRVGQIFNDLWESLLATGGLKPRTIIPSAEFVTCAGIVQEWINTGNDRALVTNAADNFLLDFDMAHRRGGLEKLRELLGEFGTVSEPVAINALRGRWHISCEKGTLRVFLTLAPTMPPTIQQVQLTAVLNT